MVSRDLILTDRAPQRGRGAEEALRPRAGPRFGERGRPAPQRGGAGALPLRGAQGRGRARGGHVSYAADEEQFITKNDEF